MSCRRGFGVLALLAFPVLELGACSDSEAPRVAGCEPGALGCPCDATTRCAVGLSCISGSCVDDSAKAGGAAGTGGSSLTATGGEADGEDTGGATGGTTHASGGSDATGGVDATGGNRTSGGSGGRSDNGGAAGTGGTNNPGTGGTSTEGNLVTNGDFSQGTTGWKLEGSGTLAVTDGAGCVALDSAAEVLLGWPPDASSAAKLKGGTRYSLSYRAKSSDPKIGVSVKVGHAADPWTTLMEETDSVGSSWGSLSHSFTPESADDAAGVLFKMSGAKGEACFDDVVLKPAQ